MGLDGESDEFISLEVGGDVGGVWASEECYAGCVIKSLAAHTQV